MEWAKRNKPEWKFRPTGRLVLTLLAPHGNGLRRKWADGKRQRLEHQIKDVLANAQRVGAPLSQFLRWTRERCIILRRNAAASSVTRALVETKLFEPVDLNGS